MCRLPTVAVRDWCDRAAGSLAQVGPHAVAVVLFIQVEDDWSVAKVEATGVAMAPRPVNQSGTLREAPTSADEARRIEEKAVLEGMRCAGASLERLGWTPPAELPPRGISGLMSRCAGPRWADDGLPYIWDSAAGKDVVCALIPVGPRQSGRHLAVYVGQALGGPEGALAISEWQAGVVAACLPVLGRTAEAAIGGGKTGKDRWISQREQAVLELLAAGKSVVQIAAELKRSPHTIHDHIKSLHRKLPARTRAELIARALGMASLSCSAFWNLPTH